MGGDLDDVIERGRAALLLCDWKGAESLFRTALEDAETPEALDGLGQSVYWQGDYPNAFRHRQRAYALYREADDRRAAAFVAVQLAQLHGLIHGNAAAVNGWIGHASRMLEDCGDCPEQGWLELFLGSLTSDPDERERRTRAASEVGRRLQSAALEYDALGYLGKARVERGAVEEGMRLIDEAVAATTSGLVADPWAAGEIYCTLFHACEMAGDIQRAESWLGTVDGYVDRTGELPISAICRMHYGGLLTIAGRWHDAERELTDALAIYDDTYRGTRLEPLLRLAELHARRGDLEKAEQLLEGFEDHPAATLPRARLLQARGEHAHAARLLRRYLPDGPCPLPLVPALALRVDVELALREVAAAQLLVDELTRLAEVTGLASLRGLAYRSSGRVAVAGGDGAAVERFEDAVAAFASAGLIHEAAVTRIDLASVLVASAPDIARTEARAALEAFRRIGSARDADLAASMLRRLGDRARSRSGVAGRLTPRQDEVLQLLAHGLSNAQIAERLFISPRTAEHHVSNILAALNLRSRAEAAAYALRRSVTGE